MRWKNLKRPTFQHQEKKKKKTDGIYDFKNFSHSLLIWGCFISNITRKWYPLEQVGAVKSLFHFINFRYLTSNHHLFNNITPVHLSFWLLSTPTPTPTLLFWVGFIQTSMWVSWVESTEEAPIYPLPPP